MKTLDELLDSLGKALDELTNAEFPALIENATDEGMFLFCPVCEQAVLDDELVVTIFEDSATKSEEIDANGEWPEVSVSRWFDRSEVANYWMHCPTMREGHAVRLPGSFDVNYLA